MKKKDNFSFDKDPGKLKDSSNDLDFTFSDIPVLGVKKETKDAFSFDSLKDDKENSSTSFETLLTETVFQDDLDDDSEQIALEEIRLKEANAKKRRRKRNIIFFAVGIVLVVLVSIASFFFVQTDSQPAGMARRPTFSKKKLSEKEKKELELKRLKEKIEKILAEANNHFNIQEFDEAQKLYSQIVELDPENSAALFGIAECLTENGKIKDAEIFYKKSINSGNASQNSYQKLADMYLKNNKMKERAEVLAKAYKAYPKNEYFAMDYAESLVKNGENEKALAVYQKIPRKVMSELALMNFADISTGFSKKNALEIYKYLGNKFLVFKAYEKAAALASSPQERASIFSMAVMAFSKAPQDIRIAFLDNAKYMKLEALADADNDKQASEILGDIDFLRLNSDFLSQLVPIASKIKFKKLKKFTLDLLELFPDNIDLHLKNQQYLIKNEPSKFVLDVYSEYWTKFPASPLANFLRGKAMQNSPSLAKKYYSEAIRLQSDFSHARIELGILYLNEQKWQDAERLFKFSLKLDEQNQDLQRFYAIAKLKNNGKNDAVAQYADFLKSKKISEQKQAVELLPLALMLRKPDMTDQLLSKLEKSKKFHSEYKLFKAQRYLIFPGKQSDAFSGAPMRGKFREFCILDMLRRGKLKQVLMMPTPREEFPEFWKIFLARRKNLKSWKKSAEEFLKKPKNNTNTSLKLIVKLWLGQINVAAAEKKMDIIPFDKHALFLFMLADEYKRMKNHPKSTIRYRKAFAYDRNIYTDVIKYFMKH